MGASPSAAHDDAKVCTIVAADPSVGFLDGNKASVVYHPRTYKAQDKASTCTSTQVSVWPCFSAQ